MRYLESNIIRKVLILLSFFIGSHLLASPGQEKSFYRDLAETTCEKQASCQEAFFNPSHMDLCIADNIKRYMNYFDESGIQNLSLIKKQCESAVEKLSCTAFNVTAPVFQRIEDCRIIPKLAIDETCSLDNHCQSQYCKRKMVVSYESHILVETTPADTGVCANLPSKEELYYSEWEFSYPTVSNSELILVGETVQVGDLCRSDFDCMIPGEEVFCQRPKSSNVEESGRCQIKSKQVGNKCALHGASNINSTCNYRQSGLLCDVGCDSLLPDGSYNYECFVKAFDQGISGNCKEKPPEPSFVGKRCGFIEELNVEATLKTGEDQFYVYSEECNYFGNYEYCAFTGNESTGVCKNSRLPGESCNPEFRPDIFGNQCLGINGYCDQKSKVCKQY